MKIILLGPKNNNAKSFDGIVWNFYLPLKSLGHEVFLLNTLVGDNTDRLEALVEKVEPDIIFSILTGDSFQAEPLQLIKKYTEDTDIITFNLFCDDSWRFDNFSSDMCWNFDVIGTTEPNVVEKYKQLGYDNVILTQWHANEDLYSIETDKPKLHDVIHIGALYPDRKEKIKFLHENGINVKAATELSFSQMIDFMSQSVTCLNFAENPNDPEKKTQMKLRPFEIAACNSLCLTEYHEGMEKYFEPNKEMVFFNDMEECLSKLKKLLDRKQVALTLSKRGHERFLEDHTSKIQLSKLLEEIRNGAS